MAEEKDSEETCKMSVGLQRDNIKHFVEVHGYLPGSSLQYDNDRTQVQRLKLSALNIGIFGGIGSGKSCFINSVESVFSGEYSDHAGENRIAGDPDKSYSGLNTSTTAERIKVRIGERMSLIDNRGFPKKCGDKVAEEVVKQCEGTRKFGSFVPENWNNCHWQKFKDSICGTFRSPSLKQRIHCAILVYSLHDDVEPKDFTVVIAALRKACGRFPIIVLTYVDEVNEEILRRRWSQFQTLHCSRVFSIKNYNIHDHKPTIETDNTIVDILHNCCIITDQVLLQTMEDATGMCC